jgi:Rieske Fe-S protein
MTNPVSTNPVLTRRTALSLGTAGLGAVALAACTPAAASAPNAGQPAAPSTPTKVGTLAEVPVGGATSAKLGDTPIILTQPKSGTITGFSAVCTHRGCTVAPAADNKEFDCPCHGSKYDAVTGEVISGPAPAPLPKLSITLNGDAILASLA